jgi:hypothetical protein
MEIRKPNLDVMNRFGDITEREVNENVIRSVQKKKKRKRARTVSGDSLCHFRCASCS